VGMIAQLKNRLTVVEARSQHTQETLQEFRQETRVALQELRQEMRETRVAIRQFTLTTQRQMWTIITVITGALVVGLMKLVFFPGGTP
jgi:hypothetical protein